ncbi:hypothetical protein ScPMuIL_000417 [Solemya velum]
MWGVHSQKKSRVRSSIDNTCYSHYVADDQLAASSEYNNKDYNYGPERARLGSVTNGLDDGAWSAHVNNVYQFVQVEFDNVKLVTEIATKGRANHTEMVTRYYVDYSTDGFDWKAVRGVTDNVEFFEGNTDVELLVHGLSGYRCGSEFSDVMPETDCKHE